MPSASSTLFLFASLLGAQARVLPDACPASCSDTSAYGLGHHRLQDLSHCGKEVHLSEVFHIDGEDVVPEISICSTGEATPLEEQKRQVNDPVEDLVDFHMPVNSSGLAIPKMWVDHFTGRDQDRGADHFEPTSPYWVEIRLTPSNISLGFYAGKDVDPTSLTEAIYNWGQEFVEGASTFAAQHCGLSKNKSIGFVIDGNGVDQGVVRKYMETWALDKCVFDFEEEHYITDVPITFRNDVWIPADPFF